MLHQGLNQNLAYAEVELDRTLLFFFYPVLEFLCYKNSEKGNQLRLISIFKLIFSVTTGQSSCTKISNVNFSVLMEYTEEAMHFLVCGKFPIAQKLTTLFASKLLHFQFLFPPLLQFWFLRWKFHSQVFQSWRWFGCEKILIFVP